MQAGASVLESCQAIEKELASKVGDDKTVPGKNSFIFNGYQQFEKWNIEQKVAFFADIAKERYKQCNDIAIVFREQPSLVTVAFRGILDEIGYPATRKALPEFFLIAQNACVLSRNLSEAIEREKSPTKEEDAAIKTLTESLSNPSDTALDLLIPLYLEYMKSSKATDASFARQVANYLIIWRVHGLLANEVDALKINDNRDAITKRSDSGNMLEQTVLQVGMQKLFRQYSIMDGFMEKLKARARMREKEEATHPLESLSWTHRAELFSIYPTRENEYQERLALILPIYEKMDKLSRELLSQHLAYQDNPEMLQKITSQEKSLDHQRRKLIRPFDPSLSNEYLSGIKRTVQCIEQLNEVDNTLYKTNIKSHKPVTTSSKGFLSWVGLPKMPSWFSRSTKSDSKKAPSYTSDEFKRFDALLSGKDMLACLKEPVLLQAYYHYARDNFCPETIEFMMQVGKLIHVDKSETQKRDRIDAVCAKDLGAINVPQYIKNNVLKTRDLGNVDSCVLAIKGAAAEVLAMIQHDNFARFASEYRGSNKLKLLPVQISLNIKVLAQHFRLGDLTAKRRPRLLRIPEERALDIESDRSSHADMPPSAPTVAKEPIELCAALFRTVNKLNADPTPTKEDWLKVPAKGPVQFNEPRPHTVRVITPAERQFTLRPRTRCQAAPTVSRTLSEGGVPKPSRTRKGTI